MTIIRTVQIKVAGWTVALDHKPRNGYQETLNHTFLDVGAMGQERLSVEKFVVVNDDTLSIEGTGRTIELNSGEINMHMSLREKETYVTRFNNIVSYKWVRTKEG